MNPCPKDKPNRDDQPHVRDMVLLLDAIRAMLQAGQAVWKERIMGGVELSFVTGEVFILGDTGIKRIE